MTGDTIFALSSGRPPAAIGVIRISGADAFRVATQLAGSLPPPRTAALRRLRDGAGATLDRALVLCFPGPRTATGEDLVELHLHGGRAVVAAVEDHLLHHGLRRAEPGEFTRRAVLHGRLDLAEAEGLADLLSAETETQRRVAIATADGAISRRVREWLATAMSLSALVEAQIEFSDEDDVADAGAEQRVRAGIDRLRTEVSAVLTLPAVERLRDGVRVVLAGPPNAGKSTLLNLLCEREAAIVSPIAGTTRDRIEIAVSRDGIPFLLTDTAGLVEDSADPVEAIGVERAWQGMHGADLVLWLGDASPPPDIDAVLVHARADQADRLPSPADRLAVSRADPPSIAALWSVIGTRASALLPGEDELALNQRQRRLCATAATALDLADRTDWLIVAEALRLCRGALSSILGVNATEAMLDDLFGRFCIGK